MRHQRKEKGGQIDPNWCKGLKFYPRGILTPQPTTTNTSTTAGDAISAETNIAEPAIKNLTNEERAEIIINSPMVHLTRYANIEKYFNVIISAPHPPTQEQQNQAPPIQSSIEQQNQEGSTIDFPTTNEDVQVVTNDGTDDGKSNEKLENVEVKVPNNDTTKVPSDNEKTVTSETIYEEAKHGQSSPEINTVTNESATEEEKNDDYDDVGLKLLDVNIVCGEIEDDTEKVIDNRVDCGEQVS